MPLEKGFNNKLRRLVMKENIILLTDSYKFSHAVQYPERAKYVMSYFESRGGKFDNTVFFGLQYFIEKYLKGQVVTKEKIDEAEQVVNAHIGPGIFNREGWEYILAKYEGQLPVIIKAIPEGSVIPVSNVLMTIENTDPKCYWLPNYLETLLVQVWYPTTVCTQSREMKKYINEYLDITASSNEGLGFKLHDFGFRGVSSVESAGIGGVAHLVNFMGTDTIQALTIAKRHYGEDMAAFSIPAAEHSTITSWGRENEVKAFENMLDSFPTGLVAVVSDSYDIYHACRNLWGVELKDKVMNRDGTLVIRPDSGDPVEVVPKVLDILGEAFGYTTNEKGFKELPPQVRIIQGDGINFESAKEILAAVKHREWSTDMLAFGMGGALLQGLNRDTQEFAFKCCSISDGKGHIDVFKDPIDGRSKRSKGGRLKLTRVEGSHGSVYRTVSERDNDDENLLNTVFDRGVQTVKWPLSKIRERAAI